MEQSKFSDGHKYPQGVFLLLPDSRTVNTLPTTKAAWNDPEIGIRLPEVIGEYHGSASAEGYALKDGTKLNMSEKDQTWPGF